MQCFIHQDFLLEYNGVIICMEVGDCVLGVVDFLFKDQKDFRSNSKFASEKIT